MHFDSFQDFLAMGGYASYVWSAFGLTFGALFLLLWVSIKDSKSLKHEVKQKLARKERIEAAKKMENTL
ncbi:heme exporter protein CcmD [Vibrio sp.]|nr:heme exporter protein CcmD [Vibrio sp.]